MSGCICLAICLLMFSAEHASICHFYCIVQKLCWVAKRIICLFVLCGFPFMCMFVYELFVPLCVSLTFSLCLYSCQVFLVCMPTRMD